jgi:predicted ArsR family transcriptional regulator
VLASGIQGMTEFPARVAEETGRVWGRYLVEEPAPHAPPLDIHDAMERVVGVLTDIGFAPEADSDDEHLVRLHDCPFREVARTRREVVCSVHLGLLRGIAEKSGNVLTIDALEPFVEPSLCLIRVSPAGNQT